MKRYPYTFPDAMIRAIRDGRKTQDRRVVKPRFGNNPEVFNAGNIRFDGLVAQMYGAGGQWMELRCPFGCPGDRFWVPECFQIGHDTGLGKRYTLLCPSGSSDRDGKVFYRADDAVYPPPSWRSSTSMPRWASRTIVEIVSLRVERVQAITEADAMAEGVHGPNRFGAWRCYDQRVHGYRIGPVESFETLWDSRNLKHGNTWDANPLVWVPEFRLVEGKLT